MPDVWKSIFKKYVESYKSIKTLEKNDLLGEDVSTQLYTTLLNDIIVTMESEIDE